MSANKKATCLQAVYSIQKRVSACETAIEQGRYDDIAGLVKNIRKQLDLLEKEAGVGRDDDGFELFTPRLEEWRAVVTAVNHHTDAIKKCALRLNEVVSAMNTDQSAALRERRQALWLYSVETTMEQILERLRMVEATAYNKESLALIPEETLNTDVMEKMQEFDSQMQSLKKDLQEYQQALKKAGLVESEVVVVDVDDKKTP